MGALALAPPSFLIAGTWDHVVVGIVGLPAASLYGIAILAGLGDWVDRFIIPIVMVGYLIQFSLAAAAISACKEKTSNRFYLTFVCLLALNFCIICFGPPLIFLITGGPGE